MENPAERKSKESSRPPPRWRHPRRFRRPVHHRSSWMVDGLRQPSIRERLVPSASRARAISHSSRALHISQTCPRCRQSNANTALILELKPPSFANAAKAAAASPSPLPSLLDLPIHPFARDHARARAFKPLWEMTHRGSCRGILQLYIQRCACLRGHFNVAYGDGCVAAEAEGRPGCGLYLGRKISSSGLTR